MFPQAIEGSALPDLSMSLGLSDARKAHARDSLMKKSKTPDESHGHSKSPSVSSSDDSSTDKSDGSRHSEDDDEEVPVFASKNLPCCRRRRDGARDVEFCAGRSIRAPVLLWCVVVGVAAGGALGMVYCCLWAAKTPGGAASRLRDESSGAPQGVAAAPQGLTSIFAGTTSEDDEHRSSGGVGSAIGAGLGPGTPVGEDVRRVGAAALGLAGCGALSVSAAWGLGWWPFGPRGPPPPFPVGDAEIVMFGVRS